MQSHSAPTLQNLNLIFQQNDSDHDDQVTDSQVETILKHLGLKNVYIGTIRKVIRLLNHHNPTLKTLSYPQVQQFAQAMLGQNTFTLWKAKHKLRENIKQTQQQLYGINLNAASPSPNGAAPGSSPLSTPQSSVSGNHSASINLKAGNSQNFNQKVSLKIQKKKGLQTKPFAKITIEKKTAEQAQKIESLFKQVYDTFISLIKAEDEEVFSFDITSISFITNVQGNMFNLFITTNNQALNEIVELSADYFDLVLQQPVEGKIQGSFKFNFDFDKFLTEPNYNFHDMVVKDSKFELEWTLWELFTKLRQIGLKSQLLTQLTQNSMDYFSLFMVTLLHTQKLTGKVEFNNTSTQNQETKSKEILAGLLAEYRKGLQNLQNETHIKVVDLVEQIDGKIKIEVGVRDWRMDIEAELSNFSKLFTQNVEGYN